MHWCPENLGGSDLAFSVASNTVLAFPASSRRKIVGVKGPSWADPTKQDLGYDPNHASAPRYVCQQPNATGPKYMWGRYYSNQASPMSLGASCKTPGRARRAESQENTSSQPRALEKPIGKLDISPQPWLRYSETPLSLCFFNWLGGLDLCTLLAALGPL